MKWDVETNEPDLCAKEDRRHDYTITCDGRPIRSVVAFDTSEGWVEANCLSCENHPHDVAEPHVDETSDGDLVPCQRRFEGEVEVWAPDGSLAYA